MSSAAVLKKSVGVSSSLVLLFLFILYEAWIITEGDVSIPIG